MDSFIGEPLVVSALMLCPQMGKVMVIRSRLGDTLLLMGRGRVSEIRCYLWRVVASRRYAATYGAVASRRYAATYGADASRRYAATYGADASRRYAATYGADASRRYAATYGAVASRRYAATYGAWSRLGDTLLLIG